MSKHLSKYAQKMKRRRNAPAYQADVLIAVGGPKHGQIVGPNYPNLAPKPGQYGVRPVVNRVSPPLAFLI